MKKTKIILLSLTSLVLTGCGYAYRDVYRRDEYVSSNYLENYYDIWDERIDENNEKNQIIKKNEREVTNDDNLFLSYNSDNFLNVEPKRDELQFKSGVEDEESFGKQRKVTNYDSSFKYGILSKLFDGRCFCEGHYERARVQVKPSNKEIEGFNYKSGFGYMFPKECVQATYFAMAFRCATNPKPTNTTNCKSDITLSISFYINNANGNYVKNTYKFNLADATTNNGGHYDNDGYSFVGFQFSKDLPITLCSGFSIEYSVNDVYKMNGEEKMSVDQDCAHSLMLYEVFFANSIWH